METKCKNCGEKIKEGDTVLIDVNGYPYCSEECLFLDYSQDYKQYKNRADKSVNFVDMGLFDMKYIGNLDEQASEYLKHDAKTVKVS